MPPLQKRTFPSPLAGYEDAPPLPTETAEDGKSFVNPQRDTLSAAYEEFADPLEKGQRGGL
jgi:DOPA 4,5-dioxygenase